jgi:hypothetical protein
MLMPLGYEQPGRALRVTAVPFALGETVRKGTSKLRPRRKVTPERRYQLSRRFLEQQAARVGGAA